MRVQGIKLHNWRRFGHLEINFDEHLTIITGVNESGKSSLLAALSMVLSPPQAPTTEPTVGHRFPVPKEALGDAVTVGEVRYRSGPTVELRTPASSPHDVPSPYPGTAPTPGILINVHGEWPPEGGHPITTEQWIGFTDLLRRVLPAEMFAEVLQVFERDGPDRLALPRHMGGVRAIVGMLWHLYGLTSGGRHENAVVLIDEPELHLHPAVQREIFPRLFAAVPDAQIVVATHSPFIVSADPTARTYVLTESYDRRFIAQRVEDEVAHGTANDVLRAGLGVPSTLPVWVERKLAQLANGLLSEDLATKQPIDDLYRQLQEIGLQEYAPEILARALAARRYEHD